MLGSAALSLVQHVRRLAAATSSDEQLLADFLARRSDDAFAALIGRHGPMVLNVCRRILHDAHAAEDVFQATFLILADRAGAIQRPAALAGFLHGVAYRLAVRARPRTIQSLPAAVCDQAAGPAEGLAWKEMLGILDHELSRMSDRYRAPLVQCYLEGRTQDEAARQLGWSLNTLRRRLAQGRRLLEARLRGRGVSLPAALAGVLAAGAMAVPGSLRAATLAALGTRTALGLTSGLSALTSAKKGCTLLLSTTSKKVAALATLVAVGTAIYLACWTAHADPAPAANDRQVHVVAPIEKTVPDDPLADPLPAQGTARLGTARYRHGSRIESMAVSADGKFAAVSSGHGWFTGLLAPARMFDLTDGRCLYSLPREDGSTAEALGLSPDGRTLAIRDDNYLYFRNAATGKELRKLKFTTAGGGSRSPTDWITFSPDGQQVAVTLMGTAVQLVDVATAKVVRTFPNDDAAARACVFSPDGKQMATGGYEQEGGVYSARLWEVATGKEVRRFAIGHELNRPIGALAFAHDGTMLAGGAYRDGRLHLFEVATGKQLHVFPKIGNEILGVAFAPDGKTVAAAGDHIHFYDPLTGKEKLRIERRARGLAFSQDGAVLTGAVSGAIYRWDAATGRQLTPAAAQDSAVEQILVSADGRQVFTTDQDGDLYLWDAAGGKPPRRIEDQVELGVVASPDRRFLGWTVRNKYGNSHIRLYDIPADRFIDRFPTIAGEASLAAFLPDGKSLLTLEGGPPTFRLWDIDSGKQLRSFVAIPPKAVGNPGMRLVVVPFCTPRRAALSPDGKTLAIGPDFPEGIRMENGAMPVRLWDVATGKAGRDLNQPMNGNAVPDESALRRTERLGGETHRQMKSMNGRAFSPDGRFLVDWAEHPHGSSRIDHIYVWDPATGRAVATLAGGPRAGAANAAFAPDGRTLATASADGTVRLWETTTWKVRAEFRGHRDRVTALAFRPDGRLFTGGHDTVVLQWNVQPPKDAAKGTLADAWGALTNQDPKAGFAAQGRFLAEPAKAVAWFAAKVTPAVQPDPAHVHALIKELDDPTFAIRERATAQLKDLWPITAPALRAVVAKSATLESGRRIERIIHEMENSILPAKLRDLRAAEVLEWIATPEARILLSELAKGAPDAPLTCDAAAASKRLSPPEPQP